MVLTTGDGLVDIDIAVADLDVEATVGVGANPGFVMDGGTLAAEVGEGNEISLLAGLALGQNSFHYHHLHLNGACSMSRLGGLWQARRILPLGKIPHNRSRQRPGAGALTHPFGAAYTGSVGRLAQLVRASR